MSLLLVPVLLSGCLSISFPSQSHPSCSWTSQPPHNANTVCTATFNTLRTVLTAAIRGDDKTLTRLVPNGTIRGRIAAFGTMVRRKGNVSVHITPSFTLSTVRNGTLGAEFNIVGATRHGNVKAPQTVYLASGGPFSVVIQDQPMQEW